MPHRWDQCLAHRGGEVDPFLSEYFGDPTRRVLLVGGAGFDPRSTAVSVCLSPVASSLHAILIREHRPDPSNSLVSLANENIAQLNGLLASRTVLDVDIFGSDQAVVGGRRVIGQLTATPIGRYTDVVIDISALSVGISYPIIRYFVESARTGRGPRNVHVFVSLDANLDDGIVPVSSDTVAFVHGFKGQWALDPRKFASKLWVPQLASKRNAALQRIYDFLAPHDTCPILPFPSRRPRRGDELAEKFLVELESVWRVDTRNLVYAAEDDPLDLYRTLIRIDDRRQPVYKESGGSLLIVSPMGSKVLALGALMAALERDFPVVYAEAIGYELAGTSYPVGAPELMHVWLEGDAYMHIPDSIRV